MTTAESSRLSVRALNAVERLFRDHPELGVDDAGAITPTALRRHLRALALSQNRTVYGLLTTMRNCGRRTAREVMAFAGEAPHECVCKTCGRSLTHRTGSP